MCVCVCVYIMLKVAEPAVLWKDASNRLKQVCLNVFIDNVYICVFVCMYVCVYIYTMLTVAELAVLWKYTSNRLKQVCLYINIINLSELLDKYMCMCTYTYIYTKNICIYIKTYPICKKKVIRKTHKSVCTISLIRYTQFVPAKPLTLTP